MAEIGNSKESSGPSAPRVKTLLGQAYGLPLRRKAWASPKRIAASFLLTPQGSAVVPAYCNAPKISAIDEASHPHEVPRGMHVDNQGQGQV